MARTRTGRAVDSDGTVVQNPGVERAYGNARVAIEPDADGFLVTVARRPAARGRGSGERIHIELGDFVRGRDGWPTKTEFDAAGRRALYVTICARGGTWHWAEASGLRPGRRRDRGLSAWSEATS